MRAKKRSLDRDLLPPHYRGWWCEVHKRINADLDGQSWWSDVCRDEAQATRRFIAACLRAIARRWLAKVGIRIAPPRSFE